MKLLQILKIFVVVLVFSIGLVNPKSIFAGCTTYSPSTGKGACGSTSFPSDSCSNLSLGQGSQGTAFYNFHSESCTTAAGTASYYPAWSSHEYLCNPETCQGGSSGSCSAECRANSCGTGYSDAAGCPGNGPNFGCASNQACCKADFCGSSGGGSGGTFQYCPPGTVFTPSVDPNKSCVGSWACYGYSDASQTNGCNASPGIACGQYKGSCDASDPCGCYKHWCTSAIACVAICSPSSPAAPGLVSPGVEATLSTTSNTLQWTDLTTAQWGSKCPAPNTNKYYVYIKECLPTDNLATMTFTAANQLGSPLDPGTVSIPFNTGVMGKSYCWKVDSTNGGASGFGTPRRFKISGNVTGVVHYDPNNTCGGSGWSTGGVSVSLDGGSSTAVSGTGTFSITVNDALSHTLATSVPSGFTCSTACANSCSRSGVTSPSGPWNFYLTDTREAWWQVAGAPIYAGSSVRSQLPSATTSLILPGTGGTPGALLRASGTVDLGAGTVSASQWNTVTKYKGKKMDYAYFANNIGVVDGVTPQLFDLSVKPTTGSSFYYRKGNSTVTGVWSVGAADSYIIFVDGDLRINKNITVAPGGFLSFIVSGAITIDPAVTSLQGIYISSGNFTTETVSPTHVIDDVAINIAGNVISWGTVNFNRDMNSANLTTPAEKVTYRTDLIENMPDIMKMFAMEWSEAVPGTLGN